MQPNLILGTTIIIGMLVCAHLGKIHQTENEACQTDDNDGVKPGLIDPDWIVSTII